MEQVIFAHVYYDSGFVSIPLLYGGRVHEAFIMNDPMIMLLLEKKGIPMNSREILIEISPNQYNLH